MGLVDISVPHSAAAPAEAAGHREELVRRVARSGTFEKAPRCRAFFLHVCRCALDNMPEGATEQQIGIQVFSRPPDYNRYEDSIVRPQARLLRLKLERYFAREGRHEPIVITIPKGGYLPVFQKRTVAAPTAPSVPVSGERDHGRLSPILVAVAVLMGLAMVWLGYLMSDAGLPRSPSSMVPAGSRSPRTAALVPR